MRNFNLIMIALFFLTFTSAAIIHFAFGAKIYGYVGMALLIPVVGRILILIFKDCD